MPIREHFILVYNGRENPGGYHGPPGENPGQRPTASGHQQLHHHITGPQV
jgi:hypothetical protein